MPEIFRELGYVFKFYSNDHEPIHVHVVKAGNEAIFEVSENSIKLKANYGMKNNELKVVAVLAEANKEQIIRVWTDFFINKK